jgi:carbon-monoxide dehydrogenase small subunit
MNLTFTLNDKTVTLETDPDRRVVDLLREDLGLTGTKEGCGAGECGACTIWVDGQTRLACLMLAAQIEGRAVTTIEGFGLITPDKKKYHPVQEAFVQAGAVQCGFCTPGMILTMADFIKTHPEPDEPQLRKAISGNLCRCTGYQKIIEAGLKAAEINKEEG